MENRITIEIGETAISVEWEDPDLRCRLHPFYQPFYSQDKPDMVLRLREAPRNAPRGKKLFDCAPVWTLYRENGNLVTKLFPDEGVPYAERVMVLHPGLHHGELFFRRPPNGSPFIFEPFSGPTAELLMVQYLARGHGILLHSCGIELGRKGILFVGHSGAGKSTMARLWKNEGNIPILSDDRIIVRKKDGVFWMYGTPWHGDAAFASPRKVRVERVFLLRQSQENQIRGMKGSDPVSHLLACAFLTHWDPQGMAFALEMLADLTDHVPCQELTFKPDKSALDLVQRIAI